MLLVLISTGVNFLKILARFSGILGESLSKPYRDETVEVRIRSERSLRNQLLAASWTLFISRSKSRDDAVTAESMQAFLCRHGFLQHIQANWAPESNQKNFLVL
jgi:hypothetical protein